MEASLTRFIGALMFLFIVVTPFVTMRLLCEEYRSGTIEPLMTAPVTDTEIVIAKFLGAVSFSLVMLFSTLVYVVLLFTMGKPEPGLIVSAYVGLILMIVQFVALGLFCSALGASQIVAGILALVVLVVVWALGSLGAPLAGPFAPALNYVGTMSHMDAFANGRIGFRDVFYFLSFTWFWLFLAVRALESRRWR